MRAQFNPPVRRSSFHRFSFVPALILFLASCVVAGCGGGGGGTAASFGGNTTVVLLASSTANDEFSSLSVGLTGLTLTSNTGHTVSLLTTPVSDEFMHLNGHVEPLATVSMPVGIYTSATVTVNEALVGCVAPALTNGAAANVDSQATVSVGMAQPIRVTGTAMGLVLDLQVSKSVPLQGGCPQTTTTQVTPVFRLEQLKIAAQPTNTANGKVFGVEGLVTAVNGQSGFTAHSLYVQNAGYATVPVWQVGVNSGTIFQGIGSMAALGVGMPVDMDMTIQPDGSLLATRVAVYDSNTTNLSVGYGPLTGSYPPGAYHSALPTMSEFLAEQTGNLQVGFGLYALNAQAAISGQFTNLRSLPFAPTFDSSNLVDGQNVLFSTHTPLFTYPQVVSTVTLLPQTINGTVKAISSEGNFTVYTVALAPYDPFADMANQPGQTTLLKNPGTVEVYADGNTQMLNPNKVSTGNVFRFYGLVFNDNGMLRMDCSQVSDGVPV